MKTYRVTLQDANNSQWGEGWIEEVKSLNKETAMRFAIARIKTAIEQPNAEVVVEDIREIAAE